MQFARLKYAYIIILLAVLLGGCYRDKPFAKPENINDLAIPFPFFLTQKTMITNREQSNDIEGTYLKVIEVINDSTYKINLPDSFYINAANYTSWMIGWPTGKAYYDAGNENLSKISAIDPDKKIVITGELLRGAGRPILNQRIVFWNRAPSGFKNSGKGMLVNPQSWPTIAGHSIEFGAIIYDSLRQQWVMFVQEVDTTHVNIYAAVSADLVKWVPANNGKALFKPQDFDKTNWAGTAVDAATPQTARLYSAIFDKGKWYFFLSGYARDGKRSIGIIMAQDPINGPFEIMNAAVLSPGKNDYDMNGCFYPKVCKAGNKFLLYYDGVGMDGVERVCMAESHDLITWEKYNKNPVINGHYGWRSGLFTSEPNYVQYSNDTAWLMCGGYKKYNTEFNIEDSTLHRLPLDTSIFNVKESEKGQHISGNVMDAELGVFISMDGGYTFRPHINNPVWINDYSDTLQNDHLGGDFFYAQRDKHVIIIYQAKSEATKGYNILLRYREW